MATELQEAPTVGEITFEDGIEDIPEMVCHLYDIGEPTALCGIHHRGDPHCQMHGSDDAVHMPMGTRFCPCGAPVCEACFALNS